MDTTVGTAAERAADALRRRITEGELPPSTQLSEEGLVARLGVSRNTLREAFRLLAHDGLLVHRRNRGVFVSELDESDLVDLYRLRRIVECDVVGSLRGLSAEQLAPLRREIETAESAAARDAWGQVGTANMHFHQLLVGLAGSPRIDDVVRRLLAELRLIFNVVANAHALYAPYVGRNRVLLELLAAGQTRQAAAELDRYLRDSEEQLLAAYREKRPSPGLRRLSVAASGTE